MVQTLQCVHREILRAESASERGVLSKPKPVFLYVIDGLVLVASCDQLLMKFAARLYLHPF